MPLTRPRFSQFDTTISSISDPITVLNKTSTLANIDIGFILNRDGGTSSNVAFFWQESANTFVLAFSSNTGEVTSSISNSNIDISSYANLRVNTLTSGNILASGNITAPYFLGNGSQLSGIITSVVKIISGTSDVTTYENGNIAVSVGGTANTVIFTSSNTFIKGSLIPTANLTFELGSPTRRFHSAYFGGSTIYIGNSSISESTIPFIASFPTGDYGDLVTSTVDAFGVQSATSFDLNAEGGVTTIDLEELS